MQKGPGFGQPEKVTPDDYPAPGDDTSRIFFLNLLQILTA